MRFGKTARMSSPSELLPDRGATTERLLLREFPHRINDELASVISLSSVAANRRVTRLRQWTQCHSTAGSCIPANISRLRKTGGTPRIQ